MVSLLSSITWMDTHLFELLFDLLVPRLLLLTRLYAGRRGYTRTHGWSSGARDGRGRCEWWCRAEVSAVRATVSNNVHKKEEEKKKNEKESKRRGIEEGWLALSQIAR
jgi:hypothetical protein